MTAHWHHLANTTELVLPSAQPSPQLTWQMDRFSSFCADHGRKFLYFTVSAPFPKIAHTHGGIWNPIHHMIPWAHNPNGILISSAVFAQTTAGCPYTLQWDAHFPPLKTAHSHRGSGPPSNTWAHPSPQPDRHLDWCSRFCRAHSVTIDQPTGRTRQKKVQLEMWANAQRDGRPAEHRWHPLFNDAKFG